jgi:uncharacterized tellurite resistance protein B-like protein
MKNLLEIAVADGHFHEDEYEFLRTIAKKYRVSTSKLKEIQENPDGIVFEVPEDRNEKFSQLYDLVSMMLADQEVMPEELKLCNIYATRFGYKEERVQELVDSITENIRNGNNYQETAKRLSWMLD